MVLAWGVSLFVLFTFRKYTKPFPAFLCAALVLSYSRGNIWGLSYYNLFLLLTITALCLLLRGRGRRGLLLLSGLCMGFSVPITNRSRSLPAMQMLGVIFGGGMTSKLFQNVREKMSLCYSIDASYYGSKGILLVNAGIDFEKEAVTRQEILRQLDACRKGEISAEEMTAAREALLSSLRSVQDSPGSIENFYSTAALSGLAYSREDYMDAIEKVTLADVVKCAESVKLNTTYFLKGGSR